MSKFFFKKRIRYNLSNTYNTYNMPNLIDLQKTSYKNFLQNEIHHKSRKNYGLEHILRTSLSCNDNITHCQLEYLYYTLLNPKYNAYECLERGLTYSSILKVKLLLTTYFNKSLYSRMQEVIIGEVPLMTENGIFIINGIKRVIVSQLHRAPGVFYTFNKRTKTYSAKIIPYRGSWLDFQFTDRNILLFKIDHKKTICLSTMLRAMGYSTEKILSKFYNVFNYHLVDSYFISVFNNQHFGNFKLRDKIFNAVTGDTFIYKESKVNNFNKKKIFYMVDSNFILGSIISKNIHSSNKNKIIYKSSTEINSEVIETLIKEGIKSVKIIHINNHSFQASIINTLLVDNSKDVNSALLKISKIFNPNQPYCFENSKNFFSSIFANPNKYDLSPLGRLKINIKHKININKNVTTLTKDDIIETIKYLIKLKLGKGILDDIDSLSNRRVRSVGELIENQFRNGFIKIRKCILEKMTTIVDIEEPTPNDLINTKSFNKIIKDFFYLSQLSQFMDQTNPLSELTHKRRLSSLGPGGLTKERAGFEVRDVHPTHYGKICPIETPEGQGIGLISSLSTYADIDKYGLIQSPYRKVVNGYITNKIEYLNSIEEEKYNITNFSIKTKNNYIIDNQVICYNLGNIIKINRENLNYIDLSPKQLVSVAASLIPFLENNDANRSLMGSNMQRQAVPLMINEAPLVGTGMESIVSYNSGNIITAKRYGIIHELDGRKIVIIAREEKRKDIIGLDIYTLVKYHKSNQGTCINQRPIVNVGDIVEKNEVIADGVSEMGELALGKNVLVAFLPWKGYNFEDSIVLSERLVKDDIFTSIHIKEYEIVTRDTRLGPEEITKDLPNVYGNCINHLDEIGIVKLGSRVKAGNIIVGKVIPTVEAQLTPEERLLRAVFGGESRNVEDASLKLPQNEEGTVVDVKIFTKRGMGKDKRSLNIEKKEIQNYIKNIGNELEIIQNYLLNILYRIFFNKKSLSDYKILKTYKNINSYVFLNGFNINMFNVIFKNDNLNNIIEENLRFYNHYIDELSCLFYEKLQKTKVGDDLPQGVFKMIKIYISSKIKVQSGDKMSGRHGNKGVVSKIVPIEDMPYLSDGRIIDMILNPLGVPSRMNVGQILETHLGLASYGLSNNLKSLISQNLNEKILRKELKNIFNICKKNNKLMDDYIDNLNSKDFFHLFYDNLKGIKFASPVFANLKEKNIDEFLSKANFDKSGQILLRDGRTGQYFDRKITVGYMYMMKLDHLVDNKIHARSIGPYSLVTQQPLGGRSHYGGQRVGEMECWALQAYGAAYTLREMLTIKSDDVTGRIKAYETIIKGQETFFTSLPESFKVMIREIRSLGLNIEMIENKQ